MKISHLLFLPFIAITVFSCTNAQSLMEEANQCEAVGQYQAAIQYLNKAIELDPNFVEAYLDRGVDKSYLKDYIGAIADYTKVIEMDSTIQLAYYNRAKNYNRIGKHDLAFQDLNKTEALMPFIILRSAPPSPAIQKIFGSDFNFESKSDKYSVDPENIQYERGVTYTHVDSLDLALTEFNKCKDYFSDIDNWLEIIAQKKEKLNATE